MTRKELANAIYDLVKNKLPNVIGLNRPLTRNEFVYRYLNGCGCVRGFKKPELEKIYANELARKGA